MHRILGIDLSATGVKAVAIEASFRSHEVRGYRAVDLVPLAPGEEKTWAERIAVALKTFADDGWLQADTIVCCLPHAQVATHLVTLPVGDQRRFEQTLPFEIEGLIPFDLEEVVFDAHVVSRDKNRTEALVAVTRREDVKSVLDALAAVGVDPAIVTFSAVALANLYAEGVLVPAQAPVDGPVPLEALVDVGAERTNLVLTEGGQVRFARTFSVGGGEVTRIVARALGVSAEEAEVAKRAVALSGEGDPATMAAVERASSTLLRELRSTFAAHTARTKKKVSLVHLTGGGSRLAGLPTYLESALGIPVQPLEPAMNVFPEPAELPRGILALSLALRGLGSTKGPKVEFRKGDLAPARADGDLRGRLAVLGGMAAILAVLFAFGSWAKLSALSTREEALDDQLCQITKKILGKCETDYKVAVSRLKGSKSPAAVIPDQSAVEISSNLSRLFPPGDAAVLADIEINETSVRLRGDAKGFESVDEVVAGLQRDACFSDVKKGKLVKDKEGRIDFDIDAVYTCGRSRKSGT